MFIFNDEKDLHFKINLRIIGKKIIRDLYELNHIKRLSHSIEIK